MTTTMTAKPTTKLPRKMAREPKPQQVETPQGDCDTPSEPRVNVTPPSTAKRITKTAALLGLLARPEGATMEQMVAATGWLQHTTRAALTGLKKKGCELSSIKADGVRTYRVTPVQAEADAVSDEAESKSHA